MPTKPKKPCRYPGCANLTHDRFCPEHQKKSDADYNRYQRDPNTGKRYGSDWRRIRAWFIRTHPLCERCKADGLLVPAQEVHHIIPLRAGGTHAEANLMSLCTSCHSSITCKEGGRWG